MDKLRCVAVDDEPFALELVSDDIRQIPFLELAGTFSSVFDARKFMEKEPVDLLFLDIQMPGMTGIQFLRSLTHPPMVIFLTAYEQYAVEGFELDVVDYLMKPTPFERFLQASERALRQFKLRDLLPVSAERTFFFVHSEYQKIKIYHEDILYIEGLKDYIKIFVNFKPKPILTRLNLKGVETKLPVTHFCRVHQSFIVALDKIVSFQKKKLIIGNQEIPIGDKYADAFSRSYHQR